MDGGAKDEQAQACEEEIAGSGADEGRGVKTEEDGQNRHWDNYPEIERDGEHLGGKPRFRGTRVPVAALYEHLADGMNLRDIQECFPTVEIAQMEAVLERDAKLASRG